MKSRIFRIALLVVLSAALSGVGNPQGLLKQAANVSAAPLEPFQLTPNPLQAGTAPVPPPPSNVLDPTGVARMQAGGAKVSIAPQTGGVNFLVLSTRQTPALQSAAAQGGQPTARAAAFLRDNGALFGVRDASKELVLQDTQRDPNGEQHLTYTQTYQGVPVYGAMLKFHFDAAGTLTVVNGLVVPDIAVDARPALSPAQAGAAALRALNDQPAVDEGTGVPAPVSTPTSGPLGKTTLMVYRDGLAQGIAGQNHLAYEVEVGDGVTQRDLVYLDARTGKVLNVVNAIENIHRVVTDYNVGSPLVVWDEATDPPYSGADADVTTMIDNAGSTYDLYKNITGGAYISYDGLDATMTSIVHYDVTGFCPNASWNGQTIQACSGLVADDVVAHEWSHAYTEKNHNLIYQWQPGALNEAYSDIFGETVDLINGRGTDTPDVVRTTNTCAIQSTVANQVVINSPSSLAGVYLAGSADFAPAANPMLTADIVQVNDGTGVTDDGCETITNTAAVNGKIALVQRGTCAFAVKAVNAQAAGAAGVLIYQNPPNGDVLQNMTGTPTTPVTIPVSLVGNTLGTQIIAAGAVNASLRLYTGVDGGAPVDTVRWLMGEDVTSLGVLRDMWDPTCFGDPGKVTDKQYYCGTADSGGVHSNSGIPNHTYALLVDGGTFNGQTIDPLGLDKAAALYWRAEHVYQTPTTDFAGHADALETSCGDLVGQTIYDIRTGAPLTGANLFTAADCQQVSKAVTATQLRTPPSQCGFNPLLAADAPALCGNGALPKTSLLETFEANAPDWSVAHDVVAGVTANYHMPDWSAVANLPVGNSTKAAFAVNSADYGACTLTDDQSSTRWLISPQVSMPVIGTPMLAFDHYVATEAGYDGGVVLVQVNGTDPGSGWVTIDPADMVFNPYNDVLASPPGNTNPLASLDAFTGTDGGQVHGSWGQTQINLSAYAHPGDDVRVAFVLGQDGCGGLTGWYVDNVDVYTCAQSAVFLNAVMKKQ